MSACVATIRNQYIERFPTEVPIKAAQSFVITAAIGLMNHRAAGSAIFGGAIAALASLVEAVTRPIMKTIFPENPRIGLYIQSCIPKIVATGIITAFFPWMTESYKIIDLFHFFEVLVLSLSLNERFYERNVGVVEII